MQDCNNLKTKDFCPTIVVRHRKEKLKKCSLRGLEGREDFAFFTYPLAKRVRAEGFVLLTVDAPEVLSAADADRGLLLLDGTWRLAAKMESNLLLPESVVRRSLPRGWETAYPRRQEEERGLASIEALYVAFRLMGRACDGLLDYYLWRDLFLKKNRALLV